MEDSNTSKTRVQLHFQSTELIQGIIHSSFVLQMKTLHSQSRKRWKERSRKSPEGPMCVLDLQHSYPIHFDCKAVQLWTLIHTFR